MTTTLGWPIPPKPDVFAPEGAPFGVEIKFVSFWQQRTLFAAPPRSLLVHTNGAENEGSVESASNWAEAKPNSNTCPTYQIGRTHDGVTRGRKMLPSNRVAIANATVTPGHSRWPTLTAAQQAEILAHGQIRLWSLAIETADLGWPTPNRPDAPGGTVGFDLGQGEMIATCIAYEANVSPNLPLVQLAEWWGSGIGAHTDPDGYPFTTVAPGKPCPGDAKKRDMREWILPRAVEIFTAWAGAPIIITPPSEEDDDMRTIITRWAGEPYDIEVSTPVPGWLQRTWRGISADEANALIGAGFAEDRRNTPLPLSLKGGTDAGRPQYIRIG